MAHRSPAPPRPTTHDYGHSITRRRFLASLGLLAGAGALTPLLRHGRGPAPHRVEISRPLLGTWVRVVATHDDPARATRAVERAFAAMRAVDAQMSVHRGDSDLARVNAAAGTAAVAVPTAVLEVVESARAAARRADGIYDPTILPLMRTYGFYGPQRDRLPATADIDAALARIGYSQVRVDRAAGTLALGRHGAGIDLGSIGKGWAVDRAVDALRAEGVTSGLVDAGGNVFGLGTPSEEAAGWAVGLFHPVTGSTERVFTLRDAAVATSGNTEQYRLCGGVRLGHLFDARRGRPVDGHLSASVMARRAVDADVLSTVAFLLGPDRFAGWPETLDSLFIG